MNNKAREDLNEKRVKLLENDERIYLPLYTDVKRFLSVGVSIIFTATAKYDGRNGIKAGDKVYFKANNRRGVNSIGRTEESMGSCEDVSEVYGYYLLKNLGENLGDKAVLKTTPYDFAQYANDEFWGLVAKQTSNLVSSCRLYGCVSKNCIDAKGQIVHGNELLRLVHEQKNVMKSSSNTLASYDSAVKAYQRKAAEAGQEVLVDPICTRYNANILMWDYFTANSDRHCKNINYELVELANGESVLTPLAILDNGGAFAMQSMNAQKLYAEELEKLQKTGKIEPFQGTLRNPFDVQYDMFVGKESFKDEQIKNCYDNLSYTAQLVMMISQNKTLFNDFKNIYNGLDTEKAFSQMCHDTRLPKDYLPGFLEITTAVTNFKKEQISMVMAEVMGEEFDEQKFVENQNYYVDKFESLVKENELTLNIASDKDVLEHKKRVEKIAKTSQKGEE